MNELIQLNYGGHYLSRRRFVLTSFPTGSLGTGQNIREQIEWARAKAVNIAITMPSANRYFASLPGRRTLSSLLTDSRLWVSYAVSPEEHFGVAVSNGIDIGIFPQAFRFGRWTVLATLIHELAHINGVHGTTHAAEIAVLHCGLGHWSEYTSQVDDPRTPYLPTWEH